MNKTIVVFLMALIAISAVSLTTVAHRLRSHADLNFVSIPVASVISQSSQITPSPKTIEVAKSEQPTMEVIQLSEDNMVVMNAAFDDDSVTQVMLKLQKLSDRSSSDKTIYLVLNTPGGSVDAGLRLFSFVKALPQKVKTLTIFAASMGFQTVQALDERLILDTGTLMSHRAKFGVSGEAPGELFSRLKYIMSMLDGLDAIASHRMGLSYDGYRKLISDEYWVYGQDAVKDKAADRVVVAKCSKDLTEKSNKEVVATFFGAFEIETSNCPLIPGLLSVKALNGEANHEALNYVRTLFTNKTEFVNEYIVTNKWMQFQK